ncbi:MAG: AAA-like domain-containing protein [Blastocatellia bacterium]
MNRPKAKAKTKSKPLPLQTAGGTIIPGEALYIKREEDDVLYDALTVGKYCNILTSRQMGKSSLMIQTRLRLIENGYDVVVADLGAIGSQVSADQWYQELLTMVVRQLRLPIEVAEWRRSARETTPESRLLSFFRDEVAAKRPGDKPIILFVDEIDGALELPFSDDFFIAMRAMYNQRAITPEYRRIVFCPVGVASPNELIKDKTKTPYNVGEKIELRDFDRSRDDLDALSQLVGGDGTLDTILRLTGGHPYLTVLVSAEAVKRKCNSTKDVEALIGRMFSSLDDLAGDAHFGYIQNFISQRAEDSLESLKLYCQIWRGEAVKDQITGA